MALHVFDVIGDLLIVDAVDGRDKRKGERVTLDDEVTVIPVLVAARLIQAPPPAPAEKAPVKAKDA